jgi:hypothetical protein
MSKYTQFFDIYQVKFKARCKHCPEVKIIKFSSSSKTNLKAHVESVHKQMTVAETVRALGTLPLSRAFGGNAAFPKLDLITEAIVGMIIDLHLPLSLVEKPSFREVLIVATCNRWKPASAKTIRARIIERGSSWSFDC